MKKAKMKKYHPIDIDIIHVVRRNRHNNAVRLLNNYERGSIKQIMSRQEDLPSSEFML